MRLCIFCFLALEFTLLLQILQAEAQIKNFSYKQLDEDEGLAQNFVYTILRDQKGLIWAGTGKGISRYNGLKIETFTTEDGLAENFVTTSFITSSGWLLFGHFRGSMSAYNGVFFKQIIDDTLNSDIISISEDANKQIWCATRAKGLIKWDEHLTAYQCIFPKELQGKIINQIKVIKQQLLVATNEGLYIFRITAKGLNFDNAPKEFLFRDVSALETRTRNDYQCWVGTTDMGLYILQLGQQPAIFSPPSFDSLKNVNIQSISQSNLGEIWIGTFQQGVFHLRFKEGYVLTEKNHFNESVGFPISSVSAIFVDKNIKGTAWVGTLHNGLINLASPLFEEYTPPSAYGIEKINGIAEGENGASYLATNAGLFNFKLKSLHSGKEKTFTPLNVLRGENLLSIFYFDHKLWVGTQNKGIYVFRQREGKLKKIDLADSSLKSIKARFFVSDKKGSLWISAIGKGVLKVNGSGRVLEQHSTNTRFIHNDIFAIHPSQKGEVWFGSLGAGLAKIDVFGKMQRLSQQGIFPSHDVQSITEDDKGNIWIATDGNGYFKYDGKVFTRMDDPAKDHFLHIRKISYDPWGRIWILNRKSLYYLDINSNKMRLFEKSHKLPRDRSYTSSIFFGTDNNVLLASGNGLVHFNLENIPDPVKLNTYLADLRVSFKTYRDKQPSKDEILEGIYPSVKLHYEEHHITFNCIAVDPSYNGPVYYRYYIERIEQTWSPPTKQHMITYSIIGPGPHAFHVQASHDPHHWDNDVMTYSFVLEIPYWETGWFYLLQISGIVSLFGITYLVSRNPTSKRSISRVMIFACVFIVFEYVEVWSESVIVEFVGSVTLYKVVFNFLLALFLLPLEKVFKLFLKGKGHLHRRKSRIKKSEYARRITYR